MMEAGGRVLVMLAFAAATFAAEGASALTIRRSCRDGIVGQRTDQAGRLTTSCDTDRQCDGTCSFTMPLCDAAGCRTETITVPVRSAQLTRKALSTGATPTRLLLRCRPTPRSVGCLPPATTSTTTTTIIGGPTTTRGTNVPGQTTTSTTIGLIRHPRITSTTTTTGASTSFPFPSITTTSLIPIPCLGGDRECDGLSTACAMGFCGFDQFCKQAFFCVRPDSEATCVLDEAAICLTPADCPRLVGDECRLCYLNRCVTAPAPACF